MNAKEVAFADGFSVTCSVNSIKDYWAKLIAIGPNTATSLNLRNLFW